MIVQNIPRATRRNFIPAGPVLDREMVQETLDLWEGTDSVLQAPIIDKWEEKVAFWNQQQWTKFRDRTVTNQVYCLVMRLRYDHF